MEFTPKSIDRIGKLLFGPRYVSEFSRALGVSRVTVLSWISGEWKPKDENTSAIKKLVEKRVKDLTKELG